MDAATLVISPHVMLAVGLGLILVIVVAMAGFVWMGGRSERRGLLNAVLFAFATLLGVWVADKTIGYQLNLLNDSESSSLFSLVKDALLLVFGFYFGSNSKGDSNESDDHEPR